MGIDCSTIHLGGIIRMQLCELNQEDNEDYGRLLVDGMIGNLDIILAKGMNDLTHIISDKSSSNLSEEVNDLYQNLNVEQALSKIQAILMPKPGVTELIEANNQIIKVLANTRKVIKGIQVAQLKLPLDITIKSSDKLSSTNALTDEEIVEFQRISANIDQALSIVNECLIPNGNFSELIKIVSNHTTSSRATNDVVSQVLKGLKEAHKVIKGLQEAQLKFSLENKIENSS